MVRFLSILSHGLLTNYDLNLATWSMFFLVNLVTWMATNVWVESGFVCNGICLNQLNLRAYRCQDVGFISPHWQLEKIIRQHKGCQISAVIQKIKSQKGDVMCLPSGLRSIMVTDRIMEKNVQLKQAAPASNFSIIGFFPIRVQNIPEVIRTFFPIIFGGGHYFHTWFFLWNQGARADWPLFP